MHNPYVEECPNCVLVQFFLLWLSVYLANQTCGVWNTHKSEIMQPADVCSYSLTAANCIFIGHWMHLKGRINCYTCVYCIRYVALGTCEQCYIAQYRRKKTDVHTYYLPDISLPAKKLTIHKICNGAPGILLTIRILSL